MTAGFCSMEFVMFQMRIPDDEASLTKLYERGEAAIPGGVCSSTRRNRAWDKPVYGLNGFEGTKLRPRNAFAPSMGRPLPVPPANSK